MAGLLVSVRDDREAQSAVRGGAAIVDIKEPARGPLGRADVAAWTSIREALPRDLPLSVALGELTEWQSRGDAARPRFPDSRDFEGITFRKLGLAGVDSDWREQWQSLRRSLGIGQGWVAVAYSDWETAGAPTPDQVLDEAIAAECAGVLVDTYDKSRSTQLDLTWSDWIGRAQSARLLVALAGRLDLEQIERLAPLRPDLFAVRSAACEQGHRNRPIDAGRVAKLAKAARSVPSARA